MEPREAVRRAKHYGRLIKTTRCSRCPNGIFTPGFGLHDASGAKPLCWECAKRDLMAEYDRRRREGRLPAL